MRVVRRAGRPVRRLAHWFVGQPHLVAMMQDQQTLLLEQRQALAELSETLANLKVQVRAAEENTCEHVDAVILAQEAARMLAERRVEGITEEINLLDGYIDYQLDRLRNALESRIDQAPMRLLQVGTGIDAVLRSEGFDIVVPTREEGLLVFLSRHGVSGIEPGVRAALSSILRPGDVAVDVGANIGVHSLAMAAAVGGTGKVFCFEPMPHIAAALARTLRLNGFAGHCDVHQIALSDETRDGELFAAAHSPLSSLFELAPDVAHHPVGVRVTTLDEALPAGSRVDLVKMDVEGAEPRVWAGMRRVREENPQLSIVLEWSVSHFQRAGGNPEDFFAAISAAGFQVQMIDDARPGRFDEVTIEQASHIDAGNFLLRPVQAVRGTTL